MNMVTINGRQIYTVSYKDLGTTPKPSRFAELSKSWKEGNPNAGNGTLTADKINELKAKYNTSNMTDAENLNLMRELVEAGVISKNTAEMIYRDFVPLDPSKLDAVRIQKYTPDRLSENFNQYRNFLLGESSTVNGETKLDFSEYYRAIYESAKVSTNMNVDDSDYFKSFKKYIDLLDQLSGKAV